MERKQGSPLIVQGIETWPRIYRSLIHSKPPYHLHLQAPSSHEDVPKKILPPPPPNHLGLLQSKDFTSQPLSAKGSQTSATQASFSVDKAKREGKDSHRGESPHHLSLQNLTLLPLPTLKEIRVPTNSQSILIPFQSPMSCASLTSREHQPLYLRHIFL